MASKMTPEERARNIVGHLCTWINVSDEEYVLEQICEAILEEQKACLDAVILWPVTFYIKASDTDFTDELLDRCAKEVNNTQKQLIEVIRARGE